MLEDKNYLEDIRASRESVLPYAGVFKQEPRKKTVKKIQIQKSKEHFEKCVLLHKTLQGAKKFFLQDEDQIKT